ncbi:hypothetical protein SS50377_23754 [Spironucleus salmonicida]|uniref:Uncharacterized protein n=1 Tax=Spironucleus salmonicida TaxID=348837 RepID=V6LQB1_9EUKA|nr:hypothetical protein SS50377_23754 [Spironucleus salmonicida]|eukprot:EST46433.1 Hypothetical protein SS50377_13518 [Spironucleus salmonicida]
MDDLTQDLYAENLKLKNIIEEQNLQMKDLDALQLISSGLERQNDFLRQQIPLQNAEEIMKSEAQLQLMKNQFAALQQTHATLDTKFSQISKSDQISAQALKKENEGLKSQIQQIQSFLQNNENYTGNLVQKYSAIAQKTKLTEQFVLANAQQAPSYDNCLRDFREHFKFFKQIFAVFPVLSDVQSQFKIAQLQTLASPDFLAKFGVPFEIAVSAASFQPEIQNHFASNWNDIFESHLLEFVREKFQEIGALRGANRPVDKRLFELDEREFDSGFVCNFLAVCLVLQGFELALDGAGVCFRRGSGVWYLDV